MGEEIHVCRSCGKPAENKGHLCDCCGTATKNPRHICKPKLEKINFVCITCGRLAQLPGQLCNPRDIVLMAKDEPPETIL